MSPGGEVLVGFAILVGIAGIVVQVLPGSLIVLGAIGVWAAVTGGATAWTVFGVAALVVVAANVAKYLLAARHLTAAGVPKSTMWWGGLAGVIGFFVIPFVGLFIAFPIGVFLAEYLRRRDTTAARQATVAALKATGLTIVVELAGGLLAATAWLIGLLAT